MVLAAACGALALGGVFAYRKVDFALRSYLRGGADYDELDRHRSGQAGDPGPESAFAREDYWTDFRGPDRAGTYAELPLIETWPVGGPPLSWKQPCGAGYSSFVVAGGLAFTLEQRREREALVAYELNSGREVWVSEWDGHFTEALSKEGPRSTPVYAGGRLFAQGATGELLCVDALSGRTLWRRNVLADTSAENLTYGLAASPLVVGGLAIAQSGVPAGEGSVIAYDVGNGEPAWTALSEPMAYSSPLRARLLDKEQVVVATAARVCGLEPGTGEELWSFPWAVANGLSCSQPIPVGPARLLLSAGYGKGAALIELAATERGLVAHELWKSNRLKNRFNTSVVHGAYVYGLDDGVFTCVELESGKRVWKGGRYGYGQQLLVGENIVLTTEDGEICLLRATPERWIELARIDAIDGMTLNVPALAHGRLLVRNFKQMACFDLRAPGKR